MELTGKHLKAIGLYAKERGLRLALSVPPRICFQDRDAQIVTVDLPEIVKLYDDEKKQQAKERAKQRARERRAEQAWLKKHAEDTALSH